MLWKKTWAPEAVMVLLGGIVMSLFTGNLAAAFLQQAHVRGFNSPDSVGTVLLTTLSLHGATLLLGMFFLQFFCGGISEAMGLPDPELRRHLKWTGLMLVVTLPLMLLMKSASEFVLTKMGWHLDEQRAVEMFENVRSTGLKIYLGIFAVILAPMAEELLFRGVLYSTLQKIGWQKTAWIAPSVLFALIHNNAQIFLPLVVFALALTWLYQRTGALYAPMLAHALFNATNLGLLFLQSQ